MAKKLKDALKQRESKLVLNERCPSFYKSNSELKSKIDSQVKSVLSKTEIQARAEAEAEHISKFVVNELKKFLKDMGVSLVLNKNFNKLYVLPNMFSVVSGSGKEPDGTAFLKLDKHFESIDIYSEYDPYYDKVVKYPPVERGNRV